ncbi:MAG: DegV family protein [Acidimicrobiia bacterium]|nr:DegV family protein [Acidimicrobiia bacterium]
MIGIVVDSSADLATDAPPVHVVPIGIRFGDETWSVPAGDDDAWRLRFWHRLQTERHLPETVAPPSSAYAAAFREVSATGVDGIVVITPSSRLSASHEAAVLAAESHPGPVPIRIIDSRTVSAAYGMIASTARSEAAAGASLDTVIGETLAERGRHATLIAMDTMENLRRGRRVRRGPELLATTLGLKPLLSVVDDTVTTAGPVRGRERALRRLLDRATALAPTSLVAVHSGSTELDRFVEALRERTGLPVPVAPLGPVLATHTGTGALGFVCRRS